MHKASVGCPVVKSLCCNQLALLPSQLDQSHGYLQMGAKQTVFTDHPLKLWRIDNPE